MGAEEEQEQKVAVMEVEEESGTIRPNPNPTPPINQSQFLSWKRHKDANVSARKEQAARKREEDIRAGNVPMTGRELFLHEPWVFDNTRY